MNKTKVLRKKNFDFNSRNRFITSYCNINISKILYKQSLSVEDSLEKVGLIDSSLAYIYNSKNDLYHCRVNVLGEYYMQQAKNRKKYDILVDENAGNLEFIRNIKREASDQSRKMLYLSSHVFSVVRKYRREKEYIGRMKRGLRIKVKNFKAEEKITELKNSLVGKLSEHDSLKTESTQLREKYNGSLSKLSHNLWEKAGIHDSLLKLFYRCINLRMQLFDNYKKPIVETRKKIYPFEQA